MNSKHLQKLAGTRFLLPLALAIAATPGFAADYWLWAGPTTLTMPDTGEVITAWGYAQDTTNSFGDGLDGTVTVPGPTLVVPPGDNTLTIHLYNNGLPEAVSIVIPGQVAALSPVKVADGLGRQRAHAFTAEAANGAEQTYSWSNLKPGTYLYHSGSHPQVQVQMGLYGGIKHDAVAGQAYSGVPYDAEVTLLYSEIDPALHAAVAGGTYGTAAYPSTINYLPKYFLVNGKPFAAGDPALAAGTAGQKTLIRFLNAGLKTHVPVIHGLDMQLVAEDGNPYPYVRNQYSAFLPASKTIDALIAPAATSTSAVYPVYDHRLNLTNSTLPEGGMLSYLSVAGAVGAPSATNDAYAATEDTVLAIAAPGVLANDSAGATASLVGSTHNGTLSLAADGSFSYTPNANFFGSDSFTYVASSGGMNSNTATVSIAVAGVNDPPTAVNNSYTMSQGGTLNIAAPGVLANDRDVDGDALTAIVPFGAASNGTVTGNADGSFSYTPTATFTGTATFTYMASDGVAQSTPATVSVTVNPNKAPVAVDDTATTRMNVATSINVIANDSDPDGTINPATVVIVTKPNKGGTATPNANGTVSYTPKLNFRGTEAFSYTVKDNLGKVSNKATVRVNVTR